MPLTRYKSNDNGARMPHVRDTLITKRYLFPFQLLAAIVKDGHCVILQVRRALNIPFGYIQNTYSINCL